ncbi:MAG TPA: hypothetical protein VFA20_28600, partial [Myxococcaceae bacterium]|nr:hypothetical protein [Myxococcaceae bacterium]
MLMRTRRALLLLATALGLGCTQDDPDDVFYWLGRVDDAGGAPRPGATVALADAPSQRTPSCIPTARLLLQFSVVDNTYSLGTLDYQPLKETAANEDGDWFFDLMRFEISPTLNDAPHCFLISSQGPGGTSIRSTTPGQATDLEFPDLVQWAPALAVQPGPPASVAPPDLPWAPSRDAVEIDVGHTRTSAYDWVIAGPGGEIAWQQITLGDPLALDPDLLEDFPGLSVGLEAWLFDQVEHHGPFGSTSGAVYWTAVQSPGTALATGTATPVSRGAACTMNGAALAGCPLTDGALALASLPTWFTPDFHPDPGKPDGPQDVVVLSLPRAAVPRRLVMRDVFSNY